MIVYGEGYLKHDLPDHPENSERLQSIIRLLKEKGVFEVVPLVEPSRAGEADLVRVHSASHIDRMRDMGKGETRLLGDTYYTPDTYDTALLAAGGVINCIKAGSKVGAALVRPPGHHATRDRSMGFCIFNNAALGAAYARAHGVKRVAILDFDLHHGNGTQEIFYDRDVLYVSLHQFPHYPGTGTVDEIGSGEGEGYTINIPLPAGVADKSYNFALEAVVYPVLRDYSPELLILSAGYDSHYSDPLGDLRLSTKTYREISEASIDLSKRTVLTLEGGYNLQALPHSVYASLAGLFGLEEGNYDKPQHEDERIQKHVDETIKTAINRAACYWSI